MVFKIYKSYKTEICPTEKQKEKIQRTLGVCRFVYNLYLDFNKDRDKYSFYSGYKFSKWLNNEYMTTHPEKYWIKEVSSKAVKRSIENASKAYLNYLNHKTEFPRFKKKNKNDIKMYFIKDNTYDCVSMRHKIRILTIGWIRLKEKGYIPYGKKTNIVSGTISFTNDRYYISVLAIEYPEPDNQKYSEGIGIDLGVKNLAVVSDGRIYRNINKERRVRYLKNKIKRLKKDLSRKYSRLQNCESNSKNIRKTKKLIRTIKQEIANIQTDYLNKTIADIVKTKPKYIAIEDLMLDKLLINKYMAPQIKEEKLKDFRNKLFFKCKEKRIELRIVDRYYPSSRICHNCKKVKNDLKLKSRTFECECGYHNDRDLNASLNLRDANIFNSY